MRGTAYIGLAAVLWGVLGPVARLAFDEGVAPLEVAFWRAAIAGAVFAAIAASTRPGRIERRDWPGVLGFGLVGVAVFFAAYQFAVEAGGAALASVLLYTAPVWVAVLSFAFLGERMTARKALAVALTLLSTFLF